MEEGKRKRARARKTVKNLRKSPCLELLATTAADSGWDAAASPEVIDSTEEAAAVTSDTDSGRCDHVFLGDDDIDVLLLDIEALRDDPTCQHETCDGDLDMVCAECSMGCCAGVAAKEKPQGHARWHAKPDGHCFFLLFSDPSVGYCFLCERRMVLLGKDEGQTDEGQTVVECDAAGNASGFANGHGCVIRGIPNLGSTSYLRVNDNYWSSLVDDYAAGHASRIANGNGYVIRGMPNLGLTCYLNALVQCLLALGKLRTRMLGPDAPSGILGTVLQDFFVETSIAKNAGRMLDPSNLLGYIRLEDSRYVGMNDSHELLSSLRSGLDKEEKPPDMQEGAPSAVVSSVTDSIFRGQVSSTTSCKCCSVESVSYDVFYDLSMALPSKGPPARSFVLPPRIKRCRSQRKNRKKLFPAIDKSNAGKIQTSAEGSGDSQSPVSDLGDLVTEKTPEPLAVDYSETLQIHAPLQTRKDEILGEIIEVPPKAVDFLPHLFDDEIEGMNEATADSHSPDYIGVDPLVSPPSEKNERVSSGSDVEQNDNAGLYDMFSEPNCSVEVTSEDKGKTQSSDIIYDEAEHRNSLVSIEDCLALHFKDEVIEWRCENCSKVAEQLSTNGSKDDGRMMASTNVNTAVDGDQIEQSDRKTCQNEQSSDLNHLAVECTSSSWQSHGSDAQQQVMPAVDQNTKGINSGVSCGEKNSAFLGTANKKPECHEGVQEAVPSCLLYEKPTNLFSAQDVQNVSTQDQGRGELVKLDHSAHQLDENQNDQKDKNGGAIRTFLISKLPPVLIIHLKRYTELSKVSGHVSFKEILDVGPFMDPSSEGKDNSSYRLVGVIEHIGLGKDGGHYIAYVRAGHKPHSSGSSSWFCADDTNIREASLEEVLSCEAYMLFYERMEG